MAKVYYVGDWAVLTGPWFAESPFQNAMKGVEIFNYGKWLKDALESTGRHVVESVAAWDAAHVTIGRAWILTGAVTLLLGAIPDDLVDLGAAPLVVFFVGLAASLVSTTYVAYATFSAERRRPSRRPRSRSTRPRRSR